MRRFYPFRLPDGDNDETTGELLIIDIGKAPKRLSEVVLIVPKDSGYDSAMMMEWAETVCQSLEAYLVKKPKEEKEDGR
jgi:hypothetical protein